MHISAQSIVCLGTCVAINAYAAYSNPVRWITNFALGVLVGTFQGRSYLRAAREGHQPGNNQGLGFDAFRDRVVRENAVKSLANSMPNLLVTAINLLALGLISQRVQLPSGWHPLIGTVICNLAAIRFGAHVGKLFQLDILRNDPNPDIQELLAQRII
jgi:hypothetical protein